MFKPSPAPRAWAPIRLGAWLSACLVIALGGLIPLSQARADAVDVELVLAADASGSIDEGEFALQRMGYAQALRDPRVINAIRNGAEQAIAITYFEWTGPAQQVTIVPWTIVRDAESAERVAQQLLSTPRTLYGGGTGVGEAIFHAIPLFKNNGFESERQVIDISGDGPTNRGRSSGAARDVAIQLGITINGLPILTDYPGLDVFFEQNVIGGPGAFMVPATGFDDLAQSVLHKLIREVAGLPPPRDLAAADVQ